MSALPSLTSRQKKALGRYTPLPQKSAWQKEMDRLSALLKVACLKRDRYECVRCYKPVIQHPIHPYDFHDVSHIFPKSIYPLARFNLLNCKILCRKCHEWWHRNIQDAARWIQEYLGPRRYSQLLAVVINPDPFFRDFTKGEEYCEHQSRMYS